ncbi:MAG: ATP-binding protein, partial [Candidatus Aenigmarchaeota archaeon]|nr:ATP-binding protein [Candidatus Aenigmarchaeota archaeon]
MLIGEVFGKTGTRHFNFRAYKVVSKLDFITIKNEDGKWVLCQIENVESDFDSEKNTQILNAKATVIGYRDEGILQSMKTPVKPKSLVYSADKTMILNTLKLEKNGVYVGRIDAARDVGIYLNPKSLVSKHVSVIAMSGAGKSYTVAVLLEELLDQGLPIVILDPHGEYVSLRFPNDNEKELSMMNNFGVKPKGYNVVEYSPDLMGTPGAEHLNFSNKNLSSIEITRMVPGKLSGSQESLIYTAVKSFRDRNVDYNINDLINYIDALEIGNKMSVISLLERINDEGLFVSKPMNMLDLVKNGQASVINLKGCSPDMAEIVAYKIVNDLFQLRKAGRIPPLFLILEEAHNFCPQSENPNSKKPIKTVAAEGRKFGMGLCVISQRPAKVDKNVISQCNTQILMKLTNPNDIKAISTGEGITEAVISEIKNLNPGYAFIIGATIPLLAKVRVRKSKHGGTAVDILSKPKSGKTILSFERTPKENIEARLGKLKTIYFPCYLVRSGKGTFLFEGMSGNNIYMEKGLVKQHKIGFSPNVAKIMNLFRQRSELNLEMMIEGSGLGFSGVEETLAEMKALMLIREEVREGEKIYSMSATNMALKQFRTEPNTVVVEGE